MAKRKVTTIPATINKFTAKPMDSKKKRKVAGYARVSTDHEDQQTSYEAQVDYYTTYIQGRDDWEFAGLYSDEGISATNEGEVPQYYVEGNHEAIISPAVFDMVQAELARRTKGGSRYSGVSIFSNKIRCGDCGGWYGSKVWHSTDQYRKVVYRCNHKYKDEKCQTPHVTEDEVKALFIKAYNELISEKKEIIANAELVRKTLCTTDGLLEEKQKLEDEILVLVEMTQNVVAENARVAQDQEEYQKRYDGLVQRYETTKKEYDELVDKIEQKEAHGERMRQFIKTLKDQDGIITEFDDILWGSMVELVTISREKRSVTFKDGTEITVE